MSTEPIITRKEGVIVAAGGAIKAEALAENSVGIRVALPNTGVGWLYMTTAEARAHLQALLAAVHASEIEGDA